MTSSSSSVPAVKNVKAKMQKLLVYEPIKSDLAICRQNTTLKRFPVLPASKCIRLCDCQQMKRSCFPKLCDCETRQLQLCGSEKRVKYSCLVIKTIALIMVLKMTYESGFWSHPERSRQLIERLSQLLNLSVTVDEKPKSETNKTKPEDEIEEYEGLPVDLTDVWNKLIINFARHVLNLKENNRTG